jgi:hypothetical protein
VNAQKVKNNYADSRINCEYETENGKMNGIYISNYKNGIKKSEGNFTNNVRSGIWTVYDSTGRKIHQREYSNHLSFEKRYPEKEKNGPASLFDSSFYSPLKNKKGYYNYFQLTERMVIYSARVWREISSKKNKYMFEKDLLYQKLFQFITDSTKESYCSQLEDFSTKMTINEIKKFNLKDYKVVAWKIKEDYIYDIDRNVSETRIIGIAPVGSNKTTKDTSELYWIYFPMVRESLAELKIKNKNISPKEITLDDIFFERNFTSEIYKLSNAKDLELKDYCNSPEKIKSEQQLIEISLIETEHEIWLGNLPY